MTTGPIRQWRSKLPSKNLIGFSYFTRPNMTKKLQPMQLRPPLLNGTRSHRQHIASVYLENISPSTDYVVVQYAVIYQSYHSKLCSEPCSSKTNNYSVHGMIRDKGSTNILYRVKVYSNSQYHREKKLESICLQ